jgi:surfactin synthase thioesterase subunit
MSTIKLFCFPYAGGSAAVFSKWNQYLDAASGIALVPLELAGRGKRIAEALHDDLEAVVEDLYRRNSRQMADSPYAFFGHSLGGLVAYELARKIKYANIRQPLHLFFSGRSAPDVSRREKEFHLMGDEEFREEVMKLGGTSREVFDHPELAELFVPLLRSDFKLAETDLTHRTVDPFDCAITIFAGKEDH